MKGDSRLNFQAALNLSPRNIKNRVVTTYGRHGWIRYKGVFDRMRPQKDSCYWPRAGTFIQNKTSARISWKTFVQQGKDGEITLYSLIQVISKSNGDVLVIFSISGHQLGATKSGELRGSNS